MESCFSDCWKVSLVVPVFKNVGEKSTAKNHCPISLLSVVSKVFEGFRSSPSAADFLKVVSDGIVRVFIRSRATRAVALDIPKAFDRV